MPNTVGNLLTLQADESSDKCARSNRVRYENKDCLVPKPRYWYKTSNRDENAVKSKHEERVRFVHRHGPDQAICAPQIPYAAASVRVIGIVSMPVRLWPSSTAAIGSSTLASAVGDVLPRRTESSARARQETFLLIFFRILIGLELVELGRPEEGGDEDDQVDC